MSKHTPGPWTQGTSRAGKECVWLNGRTEPDHGMGPEHTWIDCCTEANARLIAAAPDLLEALQSAERAMSNKHFAAEVLAHDSIVREMIRAAIAKATGEQA